VVPDSGYRLTSTGLPLWCCRADSTSGDEGVQRAFQLGWRFAQLYHAAYQAAEPSSITPVTLDGEPPDRLPALSTENLTWLTLQSREGDLKELDSGYNAGEGTGKSLANLLSRMTDKGQNGRARRSRWVTVDDATVRETLSHR
jgi:hypothetical protein